MAAAAATFQGAVPAERRSLWTGTPEIYFSKAIDNSRLVKVEDPRRSREMKHFGFALGCLFLLVFTYAWQHFKAIEYGYQIESAKREMRPCAIPSALMCWRAAWAWFLLRRDKWSTWTALLAICKVRSWPVLHP